MTFYNSSKLEIVSALADLPTRIQFTFDLWTSPNHRALLGIVAHSVSLQGALQHTLLQLWQLRCRHTSENQAKLFWTVAQEFKIEGNIGYFTLDNASNNDTAIRCIAAKLELRSIVCDPLNRRLRCLVHIINLVVNA